MATPIPYLVAQGVWMDGYFDWVICPLGVVLWR